jgi:vesicle coat complex subunit
LVTFQNVENLLRYPERLSEFIDRMRMIETVLSTETSLDSSAFYRAYSKGLQGLLVFLKDRSVNPAREIMMPMVPIVRSLPGIMRLYEPL